jgi:cysteine desulfurase
MRSIYLDYAAATPLDPRVLRAMQPYFSQNFHNPSATYLAGRAARKDLDKARASVARNLGARPGEVIFTAGATEANNLAVNGVMRRYPDSELLVSSIEHESVLAPAGQFNSRQIPVTPQGIVDTAKLQKMLTDKTVLVSVMLINNELGTIQPLRKISQILNKLSNSRRLAGNKLPLYLHTDAAQAPSYLGLQTTRLGVDLLTVNGGKIYGPKQTGALYVHSAVKLKPQILGGEQEYGLRSGTENVAGAVGLAKALDIAQKQRYEEVEKLEGLRKFFVGRLQQQLPKTIINGSDKHQSPHIVNVTFPGIDNERLMMELDERGVQVAVGSACSASQSEASHVLKAIGLSDELARASLRFSFGRPTTIRDLGKTLRLISLVLSNNR